MANVKAVIWDLDGTLYYQDEQYYESLYCALAKAVNRVSDIDENKAYDLAKKSKIKYGLTYEIFLKEFKLDFFELDKNCLGCMSTEFLKPNYLLKEKLKKLEQDGVKNVLLSNSLSLWITKALKALDLTDIFDEKLIFSGDEKPRIKSTSEPFEKISIKLNLKPHECMMVDDMEQNLIAANNLGLETALIYGQDMFITDYNKRDFIKHYFSNSLELLNKILNNRPNSK